MLIQLGTTTRTIRQVLHRQAPKIISVVLIDLTLGMFVVIQILLSREVFLSLGSRSGFKSALLYLALAGLLQGLAQPFAKVRELLSERILVQAERSCDQLIVAWSQSCAYEDLLDPAILGAVQGLRRLPQLTVGLFLAAAQGLSTLVVAAISIVIMISFAPILLVSLAILPLPLILASLRLARSKSRRFVEDRDETRLRALLLAPFEAASAAEDVRVYGIATIALQKLEESFERSLARYRRRSRSDVSSIVLLSAAEGISVLSAIGLILRYGSLLTVQGLGSAAAGLFAQFRVAVAFQQIGGALALIESNAREITFSGHLLKNEGAAPRDEPRTNHKSTGNENSVLISPQRSSFEGETLLLREVNYRYPGSPHDTLIGINLGLRPGELIALTGRNGAGKSTLLRLLSGVSLPTSGEIYFEGLMIEPLTQSVLQASTSGIFQAAALMPMSLLELVESGRAHESLDPEELQRLLSRVGLGHLVSSLPGGASTTLYPGLPGSAELSFGQMRLVRLARMLRKSASIVILDEPTLGLDAEVTQQAIEVIKNEATNTQKVVLVATHDERILSQAERVLYLRRGRLAGDGTLNELKEDVDFIEVMLNTRR